MKHPLVEAAIGALLGLALGLAVIAGAMWVADQTMELLDEAHRP